MKYICNPYKITIFKVQTVHAFYLTLVRIFNSLLDMYISFNFSSYIEFFLDKMIVDIIRGKKVLIVPIKHKKD